MDLHVNISLLLISYGIGSIPTALLYSNWFHKQDIRKLGDGNMGARNTKRTFGFRAGLLVALIDIAKGVLVVWLSILLDFSLGWQILCAGMVILGHDFPVFAELKGGQGFATTVGVLLGFFPWQTLLGFAVYSIVFMVFHNSDIAAGIGAGLVILQAVLSAMPFILIAFCVSALIFIPFKKWFDRSRRLNNIGHSKGSS